MALGSRAEMRATLLHLLLLLLPRVAHVLTTPVIYDGRAPLSLTNADLDASVGPFLT